MILNYIRLLRIHQWIKNLFVFAPLFFGLHLFDRHLMLLSVVAFSAFCCGASSMYILNDILDVEEDRRHPAKKFRPIASGAVSVKKTLMLSVVLACLSLSLAWIISTACVIVISLYLILVTLYSFKLKHIAIVDIFCIATGFVLRVFMGGSAMGIGQSQWIIVMTFLLALFLALAKRRDDVLLFLDGNEVRSVIDGYNLKFIDSSTAAVTAVILVAYLMYSFSPEVAAFYRSQQVYLTFIFVLLGIMRYLQLSLVYGKTGSPTEVLLTDRFLHLVVMGWLITFTIIIYKL